MGVASVKGMKYAKQDNSMKDNAYTQRRGAPRPTTQID